MKREDFVAGLNSEGASFFQGYVRPLYLQPMYRRKTCFKHGYPFTAPENSESKPNYSLGACPVAERLHFHEMLINEHIRPPKTMSDIEDIETMLKKIAG